MNLLRGHELNKQQVIQLLNQCELPIDDISNQLLESFIGAQTNDKHSRPLLAGVVGLETYGTTGLLRSLAVAPEQRGQNLGNLLTDAIEKIARQSGIQTIFLLTTTAENYFLGRGYHIADRVDVPKSIQHTTQFSGLCPVSATVMSKAIQP